MIEEIDYHGWKALRLKATDAELVLPVDIGPRVMAARFTGGENLFAEQAEQLGGKGEKEWMVRGGHRLWHAPEHETRTYQPDNTPVKVSRGEDGKSLSVVGTPESSTGMVKALKLEVVGPASFKVTHSLANLGPWPVKCAAWGLSVMKHGGYAAIPLPERVSHGEKLLPETTMIPWPYTDFSAPCWDFHKSFVGIDVAQARNPQKIGLGGYPGWAAYWQQTGTFVVFSAVAAQAEYPDRGSAFEAFACDWMIELETLSPLVTIEPDGRIEHVEYWGLFRDLPKPASEAVFHESLAPAVTQWMGMTPA